MARKLDPKTTIGRERQGTKTTLSLAPLTVDEALAALLKTPPPKDAPPTRKAGRKKPTRARGR